MNKITTIAVKALQVANYKAAKIISRRMQSHTVAETLILPACNEIIKSMLEEERGKVPLTNDKICRRIENL